jgi:rare lipoprotein A
LTASGERFDHRQLTAASRHYPMGTLLMITHGNRHVVVRVNDRGPFVRNRGLDLSEAAARELGMRDQGVVRVAYQVMR